MKCVFTPVVYLGYDIVDCGFYVDLRVVRIFKQVVK